MTTDQITRLLDQIDWLDQNAYTGPWTEAPESGENGWYWIEHVNIDGQGHDVALRVTSKPDAEFIALARTALPKLAEAVYQVLELIDAEEKRNKYQQVMFDGTPFPPAVSTNEVRQAITDAMEGQ